MAILTIALDFSSAAEAITLARAVRPCAGWLKIGLELFTAAGPGLVETIKGLDFRIFLDLKFYDIPNTVGRAVAVCARRGVDMLTLHLQGGKRMCQAAREAASAFAKPPLLVGVTSLTSFASGEMPGIDMEPGVYGKMLAQNARSWGLDGVVCSGHELAAIKAMDSKLICVCPGIRPAGSCGDDQRRVMTPAEASAAGADFLVVGRPITRSEKPLEAARTIQAELEAVKSL